MVSDNTGKKLTLTAPEGYVITGYSFLVRKTTDGDYTYTITADANDTSVSPAYNDYSTLSVSGLNVVSTDITVKTSAHNNYVAFADFVVSLQPAVDYIVVDVSGNEWARERVAFTSNDVAAEMPTSLKRAFCSYSYFADANHTTSVSTIDNRTAIYALCAVNAPFTFSTAANPVWYALHSVKSGSSGDFYFYANETSLALSSEAMTSDQMKAAGDNYLWAIVGNPYNIQLLNKGTGKYLATSATSVATNNTAVPSSLVDLNDATYQHNTFSLYGFTNNHISTTNPFSLVLNESSYTTLNAEKGAVVYHGGITINSDLQVNNLWGANVMATAFDLFNWGKKLTLKDDRSSRYVAMTGSSYVKGSDYLHPDCAWTFSDRGDGTYDIIANDGTYLSPTTETSGNDQVMKTQADQPSAGWTKTTSTNFSGYYYFTSGTTTLHMPNRQAKGNNTNVISWNNGSTSDLTGCVFLVEEAPEMFTVSTDDAEYWYNLGVSHGGTNYAVDLGKVGKAVYGNATTIQNDNMAQQWKFTRCNNGGFYLINRQDRSYFNTSVTKESNGRGTTDLAPADADALSPNYLSANDAYQIALTSSSGSSTSGSKLSVANTTGNRIIVGSSYGTPYEFSFTEATEVTDYLTSGWYRIKYHKNYASDPANQNGFFGRYLYNDEVWAQLTSTDTNDYAGFFPIRVQETAAQPADDDATYYIYINVDGGNVQIQSANGHWVGEIGCANYNSPMITTNNGHQASHEMANMRRYFDGDGYSFGQKIGTTDSYLVNYETTATADYTVDWDYNADVKDNTKVTYHSAPRVWATATVSPSNYSGDRYLVRAIDIDAVGLTPWTAESYAYPKYQDDGTPNDEASVNYENSYQHYAPHVNVTINTGNNESYTQTVYRQGTVFLKNNETIQTVSTDLLSPYWDETLKVKVVPAAYSQHIFIVEAYAKQIREYAATAYNGHGLGYPAETNENRTYLQAINETTGKAFKDIDGGNVDNYTADDLAIMMSASELLFDETDVLLPPDGKSFVLVNATEKGDYALQSGYGAPLLMSMTTLAADGDPDNTSTPAVKGWNTFVWGKNVTKEPEASSSKVNTESMKPSGSAFLTMGSHEPLPLQAFMIGRKIEGGEGDRYAFVNINGDYLAFDNNDMTGTYNAQKNYIRVRKLRVSDLANSSETHKTNKQLYGMVYLTGYSTSAGAERVLTVKDDLNTSDYTLPMVTDCAAPRFDEVNNESFSSAFAFAYVGEKQTYDNCDYLNENVVLNSVTDQSHPGKYTTLYLPFPVDLPSEAHAYVATSNHKGDTNQGEDADKDYLTMTELTENVLPARTPALLKFPANSAASTHTFVPAIDMTKAESNATEATGNYFHGRLINHNPNDITVTSTDYPYVYVFSEVDEKLGFYRYFGTLIAGKAYMTGDDIQTGSSGKGFILDFGNGETNSIDNSQLTIDNSGEGSDVYDLSGRKVRSTLPDSQTPRLLKKGVYIVNGRKIVVK